jgi:hypothetical protein
MKILQISSLFYLLPTLFALRYEKYYDSTITTSMALISFSYHSSYNKKVLVVDRFLTGVFILRSIYLAVTKGGGFMVSFALADLGFLYFYGHAKSDYCFHPNVDIGNIYHASIHLVSSLSFSALMAKYE